MDKFVIKGPCKIKGQVNISGSKNASLPILAATLLFDKTVEIKNLPKVTDIDTMLDLIHSLGFLIKRNYLEALDIQSKILEQFTNHGVDPDRIIFRGHAASYVDHLSSYDQIDLMLDTFPYNGTTITCESLWMGVPVVTLAGDLHLSRVGVSINTNVGLGELIGQSEEEYIKIAVELAKNHKQLSDYNSNLRNQFLDSVVCDPITFTQNLETAYKQMFRKWIYSN